MKRFLFVAFACCTTYPCASLAAEEIKYPSPDGRFALRIIDEQKVELIEKVSGNVMVDLGEPGTTQGRSAKFWCGRVIQHGQPMATAAIKRASKSLFLEWHNFSIKRPCLRTYRLPISSSPIAAVPFKNYGGGVTPLRWLKSGELELSSEDMMLSRDDGKSYTGVVRFTISFDAQHKASVKNVGKTKTEVEE